MLRRLNVARVREYLRINNLKQKDLAYRTSLRENRLSEAMRTGLAAESMLFRLALETSLHCSELVLDQTISNVRYEYVEGDDIDE